MYGNPKCPHCGEETEISAMQDQFTCWNDKCEYFRDRVVRDARLYKRLTP